MVILLTGFEAFGTVTDNPSQRIVEHFAALDDQRLVCAVLPVVYATAGTRIQSLLTEHQPAAMMMLGVAQNRTAITPERFALNWNDSAHPDNEGNLVRGRKIVTSGPLAYMTTLPVDDFYAALTTADIPAAISNHAGAYLCNHVFYVARHSLEERGKAIPCGFIHVPPMRTDNQPDGLPIETMIHATTLCLEALFTHIEVASPL